MYCTLLLLYTLLPLIPGYYRVSYYGNGFPSFLSNKTFIYRGEEYEMLGEFSSRIRELFPNAKVLTTLNPPSNEILESAGKRILLYTTSTRVICMVCYCVSSYTLYILIVNV